MILDKIDMNKDTEQVQRLPEQLTKAGNEFHLFKRGQKVLIYAEGPDGEDLAYEVFQIRIQPAGEKFGKWYPARERFPASEDFGKWAWWIHNLEKALDYFDQLERGEKCGHRGTKEVIRQEDQPSEGVEVNMRQETMNRTKYKDTSRR